MLPKAPLLCPALRCFTLFLSSHVVHEKVVCDSKDQYTQGGQRPLVVAATRLIVTSYGSGCHPPVQPLLGVH